MEAIAYGIRVISQVTDGGQARNQNTGRVGSEFGSGRWKFEKVVPGQIGVSCLSRL